MRIRIMQRPTVRFSRPRRAVPAGANDPTGSVLFRHIDWRDFPPNLIIDHSPPHREYLPEAADRPHGIRAAGLNGADIDSGNNIAYTCTGLQAAQCASALPGRLQRPGWTASTWPGSSSTTSIMFRRSWDVI